MLHLKFKYTIFQGRILIKRGPKLFHLLGPYKSCILKSRGKWKSIRLKNLSKAEYDDGYLKLLKAYLESTKHCDSMRKKGRWQCQIYYTPWLRL